MTERTDLLVEAKDLGLQLPGNISNIKLKEKVAERKAEVAASEEAEIDAMVGEDGGPSPVEEKAPPSPVAKAEPAAEEEEEYDYGDESGASPARKIILRQAADRRKRVAEARKRAYQTRVVTITNKDNRENDVMTTVYLSFENQYFGISKLVPLDIPVELEAALIKIAAATTMTLHKDEIVNGNRTGNKVPVTVKKFAISYAHQNVG